MEVAMVWEEMMDATSLGWWDIVYFYGGVLEVFAGLGKFLIASRLATSVSLIILLHHLVEEKAGSGVERRCLPKVSKGWVRGFLMPRHTRKVSLTGSSGRPAPAAAFRLLIISR